MINLSTRRLMVMWGIMLTLSIVALASLMAWGFVEIANTTTNAQGARQQIARDEHNTCVVQRNALPAAHYLAEAMQHIHQLLLLPPPQGSPRPPAYVRHVVRLLNIDLGNYQRAQAKQPITRTCGPPPG